MVQPISLRNLSAEQMDSRRRAGISSTPVGQRPQLPLLEYRRESIGIISWGLCIVLCLVVYNLHAFIFYINTYLNFNNAVAWACFFANYAIVLYFFFQTAKLLGDLYVEADLQIREIKTRNGQ